MAEGLKTGRPLVKFCRALPVAALLFVAASTYRYYRSAPQLVRLPQGVEVEGRMGTPPATVATAVNLPAGILAAPFDMFLPRSPYREAYRIVEFSLLGVVFWFAIGRFIDDAIAWRTLRSGSRWRLSDCLMAALIAAEATFLLAFFVLEPGRGVTDLWLLAAATFWALMGYSALLFRIAQYRAYPRVKPARAEAKQH
jgi:hypothetical protein